MFLIEIMITLTVFSAVALGRGECLWLLPLQNLLILCDLGAGGLSGLLRQPPVQALLTDAVAGEGEAFVVWLCEEAKGAGLAIPAQPDLLGVAGGNGPGNGKRAAPQVSLA